MKLNLNLVFALLMLCSPCIATSSSGDELVSSLIEEAEQLEAQLDELEEENFILSDLFRVSPKTDEKNGQRFRLKHVHSGKYLSEVGCDNGQHLILRDIGHTNLWGSQRFFFKTGTNKNGYKHAEIWSDRCNKPLYVRGGHNGQCTQEGLDKELKIWDYVPNVPHNKFAISRVSGRNNIYMVGCFPFYPIGISEVRGDKFVGITRVSSAPRWISDFIWKIEYDS